MNESQLLRENTTENYRGEWVPSIPGPFFGFRKQCRCGRKFWTMEATKATTPTHTSSGWCRHRKTTGPARMAERLKRSCRKGRHSWGVWIEGRHQWPLWSAVSALTVTCKHCPARGLMTGQKVTTISGVGAQPSKYMTQITAGALEDHSGSTETQA